MIYYKVGGIILAGLLLLIIASIWFKRLVLSLLVIEVICSGILSFYVFYYIGTYSSTPDDITLNKTITRMDDNRYLLAIDVTWGRKPHVFGFNGEDDLLIIRYNPEDLRVGSADKSFMETGEGESTVELPKEYNYSKIKEKEREVYFNIKDGEDFSTQIALDGAGSGDSVSIFFLHDHKKLLDSQVYWEKDVIIQFQ